MNFEILAWIFAGAVTLHNIEEAILLPKWSRTAGRWHIAVGDTEFRFAVVTLTALAYACAWSAGSGGAIGAYAISGYALAMLLNVFIPHIAATLILRRYVPGTATGLLLILPVSTLLLRQANVEQRIDLAIFLWTGPFTALALAASIPILFMIGRRLAAGQAGD